MPCPAIRPCTQTECRYHLAGLVRPGLRRRPLEEWPETCVHDVPPGPHSRKRIADWLGYTSEGVRHIEQRATSKLRTAAQERGFRVEDCLPTPIAAETLPRGLEETEDEVSRGGP